jgi:hypothetical protein
MRCVPTAGVVPVVAVAVAWIAASWAGVGGTTFFLP